MSATPAPAPTPRGTPFQFTIRTTDKDGKEQAIPLDIRGNVSGDVKGFMRQLEAANPSPPLPPDRTKPPAPLVQAKQLATGPGESEARALYVKAQSLFREGKREDGRAVLGRIFDRFPDSVWAGQGHVAWGRQAENEGRWSEAVEHLSHPSIGLCPPQRRVQAALAAADALIQLDAYDEARAFASQAATLAAGEDQKREAETLTHRVQLLGRPAPPLRLDAILQRIDEAPAAMGEKRTDELGQTRTSSPAASRPPAAGSVSPTAPSPAGSSRADASSSAGDVATSSALTLRLAPGRVVWIDFFRLDCPYCEKAYPQAVTFAREALDYGADVYWIGAEPQSPKRTAVDPEPFRRSLERLPRPGIVAIDHDLRSSFEACHGRGTPWTVLIDRRGVVRFADVYNETRVRDKLTQLLSEDLPETGKR